ncbi:MAG: cyclic-di-AMP receptor [Erysipelotrichaceae bacterium]|nr:cyclic-di-AMP receptor [Erysipelotrichaceae bacterium]
MKLVFAIVSNDDSSNVISALMKNNYSATKLSSTGGFLRAGNATIIVGVDDEKVDHVIEVIGSESKRRTEMVPTTASYDVGRFASFPVEVQVGGATIFVVNVEQFIKL